MAIDAGSAQGKLTLNASGFFNSIQSALSELQNLKKEAENSSEKVDDLEKSLDDLGDTAKDSVSKVKEVSDKVDDLKDESKEASGKVEDTSKKVEDLGKKSKDASGKIKGIVDSLSGAGSKLQTFGDDVAKAGKNLSKYITAPLAALGIYSVKTAMTFEKSMSQVQATMGASKEDMAALEEAAKNMGETTQFTASEAAQALNYLALAGYDTDQMIAALPSVLSLAAAGGMDLAEASDMLTDGLSALNLTSKDSTELMENMSTMVDQMAKTASSSNTSVAQLGESILTVGGTASYLSGGLAEVNQVIGLMADRGIKASEAGTHLRNIILAMQPATDAAKEAFHKVGLAIYDTNGQFVNLAYNADGTMKPMSEIFQMLQEGMSDMSDMEKQSVLADIFHRTDLAAANALIGTSAERWNELGDAIKNSAGAGSKMAETQLDNLSGQLTLLKSKFEAMATTIGENLAPVLANVLDILGGWIEKFQELDPETQTFIVTAGLIVAALGPVLTIFGTLIKGTGLVIKAFSAMFQTLAPLVKSGVSALLGPATLSLGTVFAGIGAFIGGYQIGSKIYELIGPEIDEVLHPIFDKVVGIWESIVSFFTEKIPGFFNEVWDNVSDFFMLAHEKIAGFFSAIGNGIKSAFIFIGEFCLEIGETVKNAFVGAWEGIKKAWNAVIGFFEKIWEGIANAFSKVGEFFKGVFTEAWENIKKAWNTVVEWFEGIWEGIANAFSTVGEFFSGVFSEAWENIKSAWKAVIDWFSGIWEGIGNAFSAVGEFFGGVFSEAWENIKKAWNAVIEWFEGIWEGIANTFSAVGEFFKGVFSEAWENIKKVFSGIGEFFEEVWKTIKKPFEAIGELFSGFFNTASGNISAKLTLDASGYDNFASKFATGGIVTRPTRAIVGEDGTEAIIPLKNNTEGLKQIAALLAGEMQGLSYEDYQAITHKERVYSRSDSLGSGSITGGDTYIFNSPEPIDEAEAARQLKRAKQELAEGF